MLVIRVKDILDEENQEQTIEYILEELKIKLAGRGLDAYQDVCWNRKF